MFTQKGKGKDKDQKSRSASANSSNMDISEGNSFGFAFGSSTQSLPVFGTGEKSSPLATTQTPQALFGSASTSRPGHSWFNLEDSTQSTPIFSFASTVPYSTSSNDHSNFNKSHSHQFSKQHSFISPATSIFFNYGTGSPPYRTSYINDTDNNLRIFTAISTMVNYYNWSFEELRMRDYELSKHMRSYRFEFDSKPTAKYEEPVKPLSEQVLGTVKGTNNKKQPEYDDIFATLSLIASFKMISLKSSEGETIPLVRCSTKSNYDTLKNYEKIVTSLVMVTKLNPITCKDDLFGLKGLKDEYERAQKEIKATIGREINKEIVSKRNELRVNFYNACKIYLGNVEDKEKLIEGVKHISSLVEALDEEDAQEVANVDEAIKDAITVYNEFIKSKSLEFVDRREQTEKFVSDLKIHFDQINVIFDFSDDGDEAQISPDDLRNKLLEAASLACDSLHKEDHALFDALQDFPKEKLIAAKICAVSRLSKLLYELFDKINASEIAQEVVQKVETMMESGVVSKDGGSLHEKHLDNLISLKNEKDEIKEDFEYLMERSGLKRLSKAEKEDLERLPQVRVSYKAKCKELEQETFNFIHTFVSDFPELMLNLDQLGLSPNTSQRDLVDYVDIEELVGRVPGRRRIIKCKIAGKEESCILKEFILSKNDRKYFLNECRRYSELGFGQHPNIVSVSHSFITSDQSEDSPMLCGYLEMPYYQNKDLWTWFTNPETNPLDIQKQMILRGVVHGLEYMHRNNVVHCDLKPSNIFLDENLIPKIGDLDLSRRITPSTNNVIPLESLAISTSVNGMTLFYAAPEVLSCSSDAISSSADIFSFGLIAYDLHYKETRPSSILISQKGGPEDLITEHPVKGLREMIIRCLLLDPLKRPVAFKSDVSHELITDLMYFKHAIEPTRNSETDLRHCLVCFDDRWLDQGFECPEDRHFVCNPCLEHHVKSFAKSELGVLKLHGGKLPCVGYGCGHHMNLEDLCSRVSAQAISELVKCLTKLHEERVIEDNNKMWERKLKAVECQSSVQVHRNFIIENILTLKCPRCSAPWIDFDGCAAVSCFKCKANFCGLCLLDCNEDAHRHVAGCKLGTGNVHVPQRVINAAHKQLRTRALKKYLKAITNEELLHQLKREIEGDLKDLEIEI